MITRMLFVAAGIAAGIHAYTYGRWLKSQGNIPGAVLAFLFAAAAVFLPVFHLAQKLK